jgi:predicted component of type VI protein secretion system
MIRELVAQLSASREDFRLKAATGTHAVEVKWGLTMRLLVLNRFCAILPGVVEEGVLTPFALNQLLRELLGELLALDPARPGLECEPYNHLDPYRSFKELNLRIRELIVTGPGEGYKKLLFTGTAGKVRTVLEQADFESFEKATGYYLAVRTRAERTKLALYVSDPNKFKMMPRSMEDAAIFGVTMKEEDSPPHVLPGRGGDLHYFRVQPTSAQSRWDQIKADKAISLVWNNTEFDLAEATFTLFMTLPSGSA